MRHINSKHIEKAHAIQTKKQEERDQKAADRLHPLNIKVFIREACNKLTNDQCYTESVREMFKDFQVSSNEALEVFKTYKDIILKFKNDPEKFLTSFNLASQDCQNPLFKRLNGIGYQLIVMELSTLMLKYLTAGNKGDGGIRTIALDVTLSEKEVAGLQYLSGHVIQKIYVKLRRRKNWKNFESSLEILKAFKTEANEEHKLVASKDRGGLWYICKNGEHLFKYAEIEFRNQTKGFITSIDYHRMVMELMKDYGVKAKFDKVVESTGNRYEKEIKNNILEKILGLYLRIRCHSYSKDIKENHKKATKTAGKKRSLRTDLKLSEKMDENI